MAEALLFSEASTLSVANGERSLSALVLLGVIHVNF